MFKKIISKALLSVVMDKDARDALEFKKKIKQASQVLAAENAAAQPVPKPESRPDPISGMTHEETRQLILDSLKSAEEELGAKPEMTEGRQALIRQALEVRKSKEHVLEALSEEQRMKLSILALQALKGDPASVVAGKTGKKKKT
ncbi:MAG: hypothetical protein HQ494_00205 [Rhodospirillales bacterium]|nr:hypothetical protein [Rhodospirillales bacterium]